MHVETFSVFYDCVSSLGKGINLKDSPFKVNWAGQLTLVSSHNSNADFIPYNFSRIVLFYLFSILGLYSLKLMLFDDANINAIIE